jgi:hypothetical protein
MKHRVASLVGIDKSSVDELHGGTRLTDWRAVLHGEDEYAIVRRVEGDDLPLGFDEGGEIDRLLVRNRHRRRGCRGRRVNAVAVAGVDLAYAEA